MTISYQKHTVWSSVTGNVPGATHGPIGELMNGFVYFSRSNSANGVGQQYLVRLNNGSLSQVPTNGMLATEQLKVTILSTITEDNGAVMHVESLDKKTGVLELIVEGYYRTNPNDYNPLNIAEFSLWGGTPSTPITIPANGSKAMFDATTMPTWYNDDVKVVGGALMFSPHSGDRYVTFSFKGAITSTATSPIEWGIRMKRPSNNEVIIVSSSSIISSAASEDMRQLTVNSYLKGEEDPFVTDGVSMELVNLSNSVLTVKNAFIRTNIITSPEGNYVY